MGESNTDTPGERVRKTLRMSCSAAPCGLVVEATGSSEGFARAVAATEPRGRLVLKSTLAESPRIDLAPLVIHEIQVVGSRCGPFEPALAALAAGYHVLLEKPMATDEADCQRLVDASEKAGRLLQICHVLRYAPLYEAVHREIAAGALGEVLGIQHAENVSYSRITRRQSS